MRISVEADTAINFTLQIVHDGAMLTAIVYMDGGEWMISRDGAVRWLAGRKITWPEAVKRGLISLETEAIERSERADATE